MANQKVRKTKTKRRLGPKRSSTISCPLCGAQAIVVDVIKPIADMLHILPGQKYVCSGKFIYRTKTDDVQFSKCYGIPVESTLKMMQMTKKGTETREFSDSEILDIYVNAATLNTSYLQNVIDSDPFFKRMTQYVTKEEEEEVPEPDNEKASIKASTIESQLAEIDEILKEE